MEQKEIYDIGISDVSSTLLLTLYSHALESQSLDPILVDPKAEEIIRKLNRELAGSTSKLYKDLVNGRLDRKLITHICIRARKYDEYTRDFLSKSPNGVVVNIGCGLDTRFWRIINSRVNFYDLDLPEVIEIKRKLCQENEHYQMIASSVLDYAWMSGLNKDNKCPFLFIAEGVFMYLNGEDVKALVLKLQKQFPNSELICEVVNEIWLRKSLIGILNLKMQKELHLGKGATFIFGMRNSREMENWGPGIEFIDDWSYFDSHEKKLGWIRLLDKIPFIRKTQWTVHYKLT